jgi:putative ABC transport system ATP-binding protein
MRVETSHAASGAMALQSTAEPLLVVEKLTLRYPGADGRPALDGIDLAIGAGEFAVLLGRSGSGKSSLLNIVAGLDRPSAGSVRVAGTELSRLSEPELARWRAVGIGIVFQFYQLLPSLTVAENIMLPMDFAGTIARRLRRPRALALLDQVGIVDQADKLPATLSGGQQQRAAVARSVANDPPLVVADEPTGNLDSASAEAVIALLVGLAGAGRTVLVATHDRDLAARARRVVQLADGRIERNVLSAVPA